MAELQKQYQEKQDQKEELKRKAEHTELMLDRAAKLVSGKTLCLAVLSVICKACHDCLHFSVNLFTACFFYVDLHGLL